MSRSRTALLLAQMREGGQSAHVGSGGKRCGAELSKTGGTAGKRKRRERLSPTARRVRPHNRGGTRLFCGGEGLQQPHTAQRGGCGAEPTAVTAVR